MLLSIIEKCLTIDLNTDKEFYGKRIYLYESESDNSEEAMLEVLTDFKVENIIECEDDFEGDCLTGYIVEIRILE